MDHATPITKRRKITAFAFYVTKLGFTQKEAAAILDISEKLAGKWARQYRLKNKIQKVQQQISDKPLKFDESLSAFMAFTRIHCKESYQSIENAYKNFLTKL